METLETLKHIITRRWGYILVALISGITSLITKQPTWWVAIVAIVVGIVDESREWKRTHREKQLQIALKLKEIVQDFQKTFIPTGSTYSIFYLVRELGSVQSEKQGILKEWANAYLQRQDWLNGWLNSIVKRINLVVEQKSKQEKELSELYEEFQRVNHSYYRLVEDFYRKAVNSLENLHSRQ